MAKLRTTWKGVFPALVTPFTKDGAVDEAAFRAVIDQQLADGAHGIIANGSTGEWFSMSHEERVRQFHVAKEHVAGRVPLLAGTSAIGTDHAVQLTRDAKKIGCDGAMVLPPPYALPTTREVVGHFKSIAQVGLPIMVYNNPNRTNVNLTAGIVEQLAAFDSVVAIKDSSKDLFQKSETCYRVRDTLAVFTGMEPYGMAMIHRGAIGMVSMIGNVCGADVVRYFEACVKKDWDTALKHQRVIDGVYEIVAKYGCGNYPTVKALMNILGKHGGHTRQPYLPLEEKALDGLRKDLAAYKLAGSWSGKQAAE